MMDSLQMTVKRCLERHRFFDGDNSLVVAVSTGVDSMMLLTILGELLSPHQIVVAHVNHHLRKQSDEEERFIRQYCRQHGWQLFVDQWLKHPQHGIEEAARKERYRFFAQVLARVNGHYLLTAHHKNDLAETMLMKLVRTGDVRATIGMRESRSFGKAAQLIRPLLHVPKQELIAAARRRQIKWFEDQTNQDDNTQRNRFRHHYLPALERENPQLLDHLFQFHQQLQALVDQQRVGVQALVNQLTTVNQLSLIDYQKLPTGTRQMVLAEWLNQQGIYGVSEKRVQQLDHWLNNVQTPSGQQVISTEWIIEKDYDRAQVQAPQNSRNQQAHLPQFMVKFDHWNGSAGSGQFGVFLQPVGHVVATMWLDPQQLPLMVRPVQSGDELRMKSGHYQKVRRILIDQKVARTRRQSQQVVVDAKNQVLWLVGHKTAWLPRQHRRQRGITIAYFCQKADTGEKDE